MTEAARGNPPSGQRNILQRFSLRPFPGEEPAPDLKITGAIGRRGTALSVRFALRGNLSEIDIPSPAGPPERRDRLWEGTCLEMFLGQTGFDRYWEFNLSPAGHWNVYRFDSHREGMREEPAFASLPFRVRTERRVLALTLSLDIGTILPAGHAIEAAVCAVIKTVGGGTTRWALVHPGPRPDFHRRDGFTMRVPGG